MKNRSCVTGDGRAQCSPQVRLGFTGVFKLGSSRHGSRLPKSPRWLLKLQSWTLRHTS